jgi:hypothetical protein
MIALQVGGFQDHIHALIGAPPSLSPSEIAQYLKGESSKWVHQEFSHLRDFAWQDGYGAFTVSKSNLNQVIEYIQLQPQHHQRRTFKEEYLELLRALLMGMKRGFRGVRECQASLTRRRKLRMLAPRP